LIDKIQNNATSNMGRLSYVNLMLALEKFPMMSSLFSIDFSKFTLEKTLDSHEEEKLFLLGIMWEHVYNVSFRIENSVMYSKKKELHDRKNTILNFIGDVIPSIEGVQEVIYTDDKEVFVLLDILYNESFIEEIFLQYSSLFGTLDYASFDYALLSLLIKKINIQFCYNSIPTIGGFEISTLDFCKEDKDRFLASVKMKAAGLDNYHWEIVNNKIKYILTITAMIESLHIIYNHIEDVIKHLSQIENDEYLLTPTLDSWKVECNSITKDLFKQINKTCESLLEYLIDEVQGDTLCGFVNVTNSLYAIDDFFLNLIVNRDKLEDEFSIDKYKNLFAGIIDLLLAN